MKLNHINLPVGDVPATRAFLEKYFGLRCFVEKGADRFVALRDDAGMSVALSNFEGKAAVEYPTWFHVGFRQDDDTKVDAIHRRLLEDGISVGDVEHAHGAWTFYVETPGGFTVEVSHQP